MGLGLLRARKEPGQTRERTVYELTPQGRTALVEWLPRPSPWPRIQNEANIRLLAGDLVGDEAVLESLGHLRAEIAELRGLLEEGERAADHLPHRERYLRLSLSLARRLLIAHLEWLEEVEQVLGDDAA